ncbi:photosystem I P700 apoprotein A2 [Tanacetum coccineum]
MALRFPRFSQGLAQDPTTRRIWFGIATAHDFESHDDITEERLYQNIFASHFGQLAIIFLWTSGNLFHVAWQGNFESWVQDPLHVRPIAHAIWDPHFGQPAVEAFTRGGALGPVNIAYSGVYQWWYTIGLRTNEDLYTGALFLLFISAISLIAGWLHLQPKWKPSVSWFKNAESRLNHHLSGLFGVSSLAWTGHLVHVAIPASRGEYVRWNNFLDVLPHPQGLGPLFTGQWNLYAQNPDSSSHLFGTSQGAGTAILTLLGGFHPQTQSLWLTDMAHHHLAIAFIFLIAGHMYRTNFGIGHSMKDLLDAHIPPGGRLGRGHKGLYDTINNSLHFQLGLALASLGVITSLVAQHMYSLPAYAFIAQDFTTQAALYTHHQYIAGFIMTGAFAHGAIFFIRDYNPEQNEDNVLARMLEHKEAIISHLSWASLFLGFHTLGLYVHNDVMLAFGTPEKQILIEPIFAQWIQSAHGKTSYGFDILLSSTNGPAFNAGRSIWLPGWLNAINENSNSLFLTIGPGDFLVHHAIALGLHTTTLILVKGALDARGSKLMPDKKDFGYSFPCDGPGRGAHYIMAGNRVNDSHYDILLTYYVNGRGLHFGRREFTLITGFRFGAVSSSCYSKGDMKFRDRVFPHRVGLTITSLDLLGVIEDEEYFSKLCDVDAIRVCLLLCLEIIFMGHLLVTGVDDTLMRLVDSLESWNAFPWGEHIWMHLYDEIMNVVSNHKSEHLEGLHKSPKYVPTYTLSGFVWAFKVWILESFERSNRWWNKVAESIPKGIGWSKKAVFIRSDYRTLFCKDSNPIFDLRPTLAEYKSEWWTSTNDFLQVYVPRTPIRKPDIFDAYLQKVFVGPKRNSLCRLFSTPNTNVPRSNISSLKDSIIKELNSCIFKLEAIIQVLGRERNGDVVEKLQFSDDFCHVSVKFCNELNQAFLELFESSIIDSVGTPLDADTQKEFDETEDYLVEEEFIRRLEEEERLLLEEERLNEEEIRVRLEEQKQLRLEEVRAVEVKKKWEEDYRKRSYAFMNSDHMKQAMARCAPKKRSHSVAVRTNSWFKDLSRINSAIDNIWISEYLDIYLGKPDHLRCKFPWSKEVCVDRRFWKSLVCLDPPRQGWLLDEVYILIKEPGQHWCLAEFDILSGVVTFYDSGVSYDLECHDWYIRTRDCLQVRLLEVLELLNVLD